MAQVAEELGTDISLRYEDMKVTVYLIEVFLARAELLSLACLAETAI